jgi:hypothetical protein
MVATKEEWSCLRPGRAIRSRLTTLIRTTIAATLPVLPRVPIVGKIDCGVLSATPPNVQSCATAIRFQVEQTDPEIKTSRARLKRSGASSKGFGWVANLSRVVVTASAHVGHPGVGDSGAAAA